MYIRKIIGIIIIVFVCVSSIPNAIAEHSWVDAPVDRNFMLIPRWLDTDKRAPARWVWLRHRGRTDTEITLGRGRVHPRNKISSVVRISDGYDAWHYAFFVRTTSGRFFEKSKTNVIYFAIVPLDIASNFVRDALLFKLDEEKLTQVGRYPEYDCTADMPLFDNLKLFWTWVAAN